MTGQHRYEAAEIKRRAFLAALKEGQQVQQAIATAGWSYKAYAKYRQQNRAFAAMADEAKLGYATSLTFDGSPAQFTKLYFGMEMSRFQIELIDEMQRTPPGNILLVLLPPEHGKTTTYENFASMQIALNPNWRSTVASENITISRKITARVKKRLEPHGPYPHFVKRWGPFVPQTGVGRKPSQAWGDSAFNVYKKASHDERDYTMLAIGYKSSTVSIRTDHLHIDDLQSLKTLNETDKQMAWFRQDALSRPGESGITTVFGTRVEDGDTLGELCEDDQLIDAGILKVIRYPAILTDHATGELTPLWPERYTLEQLDRMRRKVGMDAWDRNFMQSPGASRKGKGAFSRDAIDGCKVPNLKLGEVTRGSICYVTLDPALGSKNCVMGIEVRPDGHLRVVAIREDTGFVRNEQIMEALESVIAKLTLAGARVTDVVIEAKNFQAGLARDERLEVMQKEYGFSTREHLTGINKYDENIGVASMARSVNLGEIELPWAADDYTRFEIEELQRQLLAWKPLARGNKLRQDRVMALWFGWILWRSRYKEPVDDRETDGWKRQGLPWRTQRSGLIVPVGATP